MCASNSIKLYERIRLHRHQREAGKDVKLSQFINLYGCEIGDDTKIGAFVEIQKNATIGKRCKISSHTFVCEGVDIEDNVFIGHGVTFINDTYPRATTADGSFRPKPTGKWRRRTSGKAHRSGPGCTILVATSPSARTRSSAPAAWSPRMCQPTRSSREIQPEYFEVHRPEMETYK